MGSYISYFTPAVEVSPLMSSQKEEAPRRHPFFLSPEFMDAHERALSEGCKLSIVGNKYSLLHQSKYEDTGVNFEVDVNEGEEAQLFVLERIKGFVDEIIRSK